MPEKEDPLEKAIEAWIVGHCRARGILCYKFSSPAQRGVPDRVLIHGGRVLFLEVKRKGCEPTALQLREMGRINAAGAINVSACWCDSKEQAKMIIDHFFFV